MKGIALKTPQEKAKPMSLPALLFTLKKKDNIKNVGGRRFVALRASNEERREKRLFALRADNEGRKEK